MGPIIMADMSLASSRWHLGITLGNAKALPFHRPPSHRHKMYPQPESPLGPSQISDSSHTIEPLHMTSEPAFTDYEFFLPGEKTLARSNEEASPLDIDEIKKIKRQQFPRVYKVMGGLPRAAWAMELKEVIYLPIHGLINKYWKDHQLWIASIDLVTISGYDGKKDDHGRLPVWLQLSTKDERNDIVKQMAKDAGAVLKECGHPNVACIILEDTYKNFAVSRSMKHRANVSEAEEILALSRHFLLVSGSAIGPCYEDSEKLKLWEGTVAAYLTNGREVIAVSNSHVVGPQGDDVANEYHCTDPSAPRNLYQVPTQNTYELIEEQIKDRIDFLQDLADQHKKYGRPSKATETRTAIEEIENFQTATLPLFDTVEQRSVGYTLWASGYHKHNVFDCIEDVGLVKLELPPGVKPANRMPINGRYDSEKLGELMKLAKTYPQLQFPKENWVEFRPGKYATKSFLDNLPAVFKNSKSGEKELAVIKTGKRTGTTTGILVLDAYQRTLQTPDGEITFADMMTIKRNKRGIYHEDFAEKGDSGSMCIVPDENGLPLLLGLLTAGDGATEYTDRYFVYPWFAFEQRLPELIRNNILPEGPHEWTTDMTVLSN